MRRQSGAGGGVSGEVTSVRRATEQCAMGARVKVRLGTEGQACTGATKSSGKAGSSRAAGGGGAQAPYRSSRDTRRLQHPACPLSSGRAWRQ